MKSIGGFTVNKTDKRLKKFYRWFFGDFDCGGLEWFDSLMEKEHIGGSFTVTGGGLVC